MPNEIKVAAHNESVTVEMNTDYGPVSFSYRPQSFEEGLSKLVSKLLSSSDVRPLQVLEKDFGISLEAIKESAEFYKQQERILFPQTPLEKFLTSRKAYSQGTLEQFMDNLPAAITLMLSHLAAAAVIRGIEDSDGQWKSKLQESEKELLDLIRDHFKHSIPELLSRPDHGRS